MKFKKEEFTYDANRQTYVAETSDLQLRVPPNEFELDGHFFEISGADHSGGDIAGWRYVSSNNSSVKALIIND